MNPSKRFFQAGILLIYLLMFLNQTGSSNMTQELPPEGRVDPLLLIQNESAGIKGAMAFRITDVQPDSPADRGGLQVNDLIMAVDDVAVYSREELDRTLLQPWLNPGAKMKVTFGRFNPKNGQLEFKERTIEAR